MMRKYLLIITSLLFSLQTMAQAGLKKGDRAPQFSSQDNTGKQLELKELLKSHKAVVLFFYRGQWCPYCNKQIKELQDSLQLLTARGAYVVGVTPETGENINKTIDKTHASFSIIQDKGHKIMKAFDVNYTVDEQTLAQLNKYGVDLEKNNGNRDHVLPVPATYVIDRSGKIIYVHFNKDYTKRASVRTVLDVLN
jgi:peroxiredoxin